MRYNNRRETEINYDRIAEFLKASVQQVKTQEDVDVLIQLKKVFKKNVPFTLRGYLAAYLLKVATGNARRPFVPRGDHENFSKDNFRSRRDESRHDAKAEGSDAESRHEPHPRVEIDPALATTIFVGIGRNRRVFPRDLVGLLIGVAGLDRERIGDIRVLANYSFVQLFTEDADKAINALNGYDYRGRKLSVSYSRQKDDDESASAPVEGEGASSEQAQPSQELSEQEREDAAAYAAAEKASENQGFGAPLV
ncbi:MAG: DbpA RNA binding domain-containing protein [Treponema sp.]|nr:DbpA RNA binding domain-containing protein [Treponema sp.]MEE3435095.1 DbpA RNA binding domain-containing protein [Treponema sp.]